ncbi:retrovirus-related pol polyprotein from transposon TNT 1-94 [Tanacetum coccineum]
MSVFNALFDQVAKCIADNLKHKELDASLTAELESYTEQVKQFEERQNVDLNDHEKFIESQMNDIILKNASLITKIDALKKQSKEKEDKYIDEAMDLEKQKKKLKNIVYKVAQRIKPTLYDGHVISKKHDVICVADSEETLILAEESRNKMIEKQNDPISKDKKVNISLINYAELNKLSDDFGKQAPRKLLKVSLVKTSFHKLKNHLASFDKVVKVRTTPDAITEGAWGFEHTKEVFMKDFIPFLKSLKELFNDFDKGLNFEINEVKMIFKQMEVVVDQCSVDKKYFEIEKKELSLDNEHLLKHIICQDVMNVVMHAVVLPKNDNCLAHDNFSNELLKHENDRLIELLISQDLVHTAVNSLAAINDYKNMQKSFAYEYNETLKLKAELAKKNDMIEKVLYDELSKRCSRLENRRISLEIKLQQSKESRRNRILVPGLGLFQAYDRAALSAHQLCQIWVYYVKGLRHNFFFVGQFYDSDLEVAFRKHTCFVRNLEASKTKSWLWHRRLSYLNFSTLNQSAKQGLVQGLPKLKFKKDCL